MSNKKVRFEVREVVVYEFDIDVDKLDVPADVQADEDKLFDFLLDNEELWLDGCTNDNFSGLEDRELLSITRLGDGWPEPEPNPWEGTGLNPKPADVEEYPYLVAWMAYVEADQLQMDRYLRICRKNKLPRTTLVPAKGPYANYTAYTFEYLAGSAKKSFAEYMDSLGIPHPELDSHIQGR